MDKNEPIDSQDNLDPQTFFDRSRGSAFDLLKHLIGLSTAGVGAYFVALCTEAKPALTEAERVVMLKALWAFVGAVFSGIIGWGMDARFYERWAKHLQEKNREHKEKAERLWRQRKNAGRLRRICLWLLSVLFLYGVFVSAKYMKLRLSHGAAV